MKPHPIGSDKTSNGRGVGTEPVLYGVRLAWVVAFDKPDGCVRHNGYGACGNGCKKANAQHYGMEFRGRKNNGGQREQTAQNNGNVGQIRNNPGRGHAIAARFSTSWFFQG